MKPLCVEPKKSKLKRIQTLKVIQRNPYLHKYWMQRKDLFSKYDQGIKLDAESWYSVTPELIADQIADQCKLYCDGDAGTIVDAFCGSGGNTIAFAKKFNHVIAIDVDPEKLENAKHNAGLYKVAHKIDFICGNYMELASSLTADVVFLSPPWGGPSYLDTKTFDIDTMPINGSDIFEVSRSVSTNIAYFLPRNISEQQINELASLHNSDVSIEENVLRDKVKAKTAYFSAVAEQNYRAQARKQSRKRKQIENPFTEDSSNKRLKLTAGGSSTTATTVSQSGGQNMIRTQVNRTATVHDAQTRQIAVAQARRNRRKMPQLAQHLPMNQYQQQQLIMPNDQLQMFAPNAPATSLIQAVPLVYAYYNTLLRRMYGQ